MVWWVTRWSQIQYSCSTLGTVTTWMGDCLLTGKPSRYVPNYDDCGFKIYFYNYLQYVQTNKNVTIQNEDGHHNHHRKQEEKYTSRGGK